MTAVGKESPTFYWFLLNHAILLDTKYFNVELNRFGGR